MKFVDEAVVVVEAGDGGRGCMSFRREKFVPKGGPDGGDGGKGGDVLLKTTSGLQTLYGFQFKRLFRAKRGAHGRGKNQAGKKGADIVIELPPGTIVRNAETGEILKDFVKGGESFVVATGGRGGRGNQHFATSTNRAPRYSEPGEPGQHLTLKFELKLLADVGIIGLPNAGKSTLVSRLSAARPKIGAYPFTTLTPSLGVVQSEEAVPFIVADIPGLIEGAHQGVGLGVRFLKHIERTRILLHLIDVTIAAEDSVLESFNMINNELAKFNPELIKKPRVVALNKIDTPGAESLIGKARGEFEGVVSDIWTISSLTGEGIDDLKEHLAKMLEQFRGGQEK